MNQQNPYGGQQPQWGQPQAGGAWGQQPQQQQQGWGGQPQQQGWQQQAGGMHPGMQMPGGQPGQGPSQGYDESNMIASEASVEARSKFIERTYIHLAGAIAVFVLLSAGFQMIPGIDEMVFNLLMISEYSWLAVMGAFIVVSYVADSWAKGSRSAGMQYAGLGLYTVAEAVIFLPMIILARQFIGTEGIMTAGGVTLAMFAGLTAYVFVTKKDFSFMRGMLSILAVGSLGLIVASVIFGFQLGLAFSVGMVVLACGYILYYTSNVLHHYRINQHVAAALALFSAVALLFWYILRIFMSRR
jgi:FtsH-binding integral membrane protein